MEKLLYDCVVCTASFFFFFLLIWKMSVWPVFVCMWCGWFHCEQVNVCDCASACLIGIVCTVVCFPSCPVGAATPCCCFYHLPQPSGLKPVKICMHLF